MPTIPLLLPDQLANIDLSRTRLRGQEKAVDYSQVQQGLGELNHAVSNGPRFVAPDYSGLAQLGQGIQNAGKDFVQLAVENQRVTDQRLTYDGQTALILSANELNTKLHQETDTSKWPELAKQHTDEALAKLNTDGMSETAKHMLVNGYATRWQSAQITGAATNSVIANQQQMVKAAYARRDIAVDQRDPAGVVEVAQGLVANNDITPDEGHAMIMDGAAKINDRNNKEYNTRIDDALAQGQTATAFTIWKTMPENAVTKPQEAHMLAKIQDAQKQEELQTRVVQNAPLLFSSLTELEQGKTSKGLEGISLSPPEIAHWKQRAFQQIEQDSNQATVQAADNISTGALPSGPHGVAIVNTSPIYAKLTPTARDKVIHALTHARDNDPKEFMATGIAITQTPLGDKVANGLTQANMLANIALRFDGPYKDQLDDIVKDKFREGASNADADNAGIAYWTQAYKDGTLGGAPVPYQEPKKEWALQFVPWPLPYRKEIPGTGTALSPDDRSKLTTIGRDDKALLKPGMPVHDENQKREAAKTFYQGIKVLTDMRKIGRSEKDIFDKSVEMVRTGPFKFASQQGTSAQGTPGVLPPLQPSASPYTPEQAAQLLRELSNIK